MRAGCPQNKKNKANLTRREFLQGTGLALGGAGLVPLSLSTGCRTIKDKKPNAPDAAENTPLSGLTSRNPSSPAVTFNYEPPAIRPKLLSVPNCSTKVADDRLYSMNDVWVKPLNDDYAVMGMTERLVATMDIIHSFELLLDVGQEVEQGDSFGNAEGEKMNADVVSPVTGQVVSYNPHVMALQMEDGIPPLQNDPWTDGWIIAVLLRNPDELKSLLSPASYVKATTEY